MTEKERIRIWEKYEDVAMHFNTLLIHLRERALGGIAAIIALAGIAAKLDLTRRYNDWVVTFLLLMLTVVWGSIWLMDQAYYDKLLQGAVAAIREAEAASNNTIVLSTRIEERVGRSDRVRRWFYVPVFAVLVLGTIASLVSSIMTEGGHQTMRASVTKQAGIETRCYWRPAHTPAND